MRVACLNIHGGRCGTGAKRPSLPRIADLLRSVSPDVVLLQEVDRRLPRSGFADQAGLLARAMRQGDAGDWYWTFHGRLDFGLLGSFGNAVLSREPFTDTRRVALPSGGGEPRGAVGVVFAGDMPAIVYTTHLGLRDSWREMQLAALADAVVADRQNGYAVLVGGDFNAPPDAPEIARFVERTGLAPVSPDAPTFPASEPAHRIDFLFATSGAIVADAGVVADANATDHALIWADVSFVAGCTP